MIELNNDFFYVLLVIIYEQIVRVRTWVGKPELEPRVWPQVFLSLNFYKRNDYVCGYVCLGY